ncbi:HtaA domain-containing protein [Conexibacter sp. SYSU D00693]|uniref:HtaA domain-containing protein n=1 Tax=Conexibacter sp. SYSU D00693 TaxID=2812560 RepID=UPI00196B4999|nr:HtaA domain-containing protein [Conexibacter sp. SYSU D00693]
MTRRTLALAAALAVAGAVPAAAQEPSGSATLSISGAGAKGLGAPESVALPVLRGSLSSSATIQHEGKLRLKAGRRSVTLTRLRTTIGARSTVTAILRDRRRTIFTITGGRRSTDAAKGTVTVRGARLTLTKAAGQQLRKALRLRRTPRGRFGTVSLTATLPKGSGAPTGGAGTSPSAPGSSGGGTPTSVAPTAPVPQLDRPAGAVDVAASSVQWHVRESFIRYINTGEGTSVADGASALPPTVRPGSDASLHYDFAYAPAGGWFDPATGQGKLQFKGRLRFLYSDHGIDLSAHDPEVQLGGDPLSTFRFTGGLDTNPGDRRADLIRLDVAKARAVTTSPDGRTRTYEQVPGRLTKNGSGLLGNGIYAEGDEFGWMTISVTTP